MFGLVALIVAMLAAKYAWMRRILCWAMRVTSWVWWFPKLSLAFIIGTHLGKTYGSWLRTLVMFSFFRSIDTPKPPVFLTNFRIIDIGEDFKIPPWLVVLTVVTGVCLMLYVLVKLMLLFLRACYYVYSRVQLGSGTVCAFGEKMRVGSLLEPVVDMPRFQAEVWTRRGGAFVKSGQGFLTKIGFFTAYHVIEDASEVQVVTPNAALAFKVNEFEQRESDVALLQLTQSQVGRLGMRYAKLVPTSVVTERSGLLVKVQAFGNRTMGLLKPGQGFGLCEYSGSTVKGFSGAPYCVANNVYGMHIGGCTVNLGFEAAYLYMLAKKHEESTEDWLEEEIMNSGREYRWQRSPYDPDEARVEVDGKYYQVDIGVARDWDKRLKVFRKVEYVKPEYEEEGMDNEVIPEREVHEVENLPKCPRDLLHYADSKNLIRGPERVPIVASAGELGQASQEEVVQDQPALPLREIDLESLRKLVTSVIAGQQKIPAQLKDRLPSTPKLTKNKRRQLRFQELKSKTLQLQQQLDHIQLGKPELQEASTSGSV